MSTSREDAQQELVDFADELDFVDRPSKFKLTCRPVQSDKTFICISDIERELEMSGGRSLQVIFTMNTITSNVQFSSRVIQTINDTYGADSIVIFNSRDERPRADASPACIQVKEFSDVLDGIYEGHTRVLIMCCHATRIWKGNKGLLRILKGMSRLGDEFRRPVTIHVDEIHKYVDNNRRFAYEKFHQSDLVQKICLYTATPGPVFCNRALWEKMTVVDQREHLLDPVKYRGVTSTTHVPITDAEISEEFYVEKPSAKLIELANYKGNNRLWFKNGPFGLGQELQHLKIVKYVIQTKLNLVAGSFHLSFIPGASRKLTHWKVAELVHEACPEACVLLINGDGAKLLRMTAGGRTQKDLVIQDKELNDVLREEFSTDPTLLENPFVITGLQCVGMSMSLVHPSYGNFHSIVLSHGWMSNEDLYQLRRDCFSTRNWTEEQLATNLRTTHEYSFPDTRNRSLKYEKLSIGISHMRGEITAVDAGIATLPVDPFRKKVRPRRTIIDVSNVEMKEFADFTAMREYVGTHFQTVKGKRAGVNKRKPTPEGFYKNELTKDITTVEHIREHRSLGLASRNKKFRVHPCYRDTSDASTLVWCVCFGDSKV